MVDPAALSSSQAILVVEDNDEDYEVTIRAISHSNLINPIHRCLDGDDALDFLFKRTPYQHVKSPGLILLDLNLPGTDGREVLRTIKNDPDLKDVPVIVFSTSEDSRDIESFYEAGANSYVLKPLTIKSLFEAITRLQNYGLEVVIVPKKTLN